MASLVIIGGKESGVGSAMLALAHGWDVLVSDAGSIVSPYREELLQLAVTLEENGHSSDMAGRFDLMVISPGVPDNSPLVRDFVASGKEVISEIEFAYRHKGDSIILAVTGSNGKTTLSSLLYHIMRKNEMDVRLVGNVGYSFARTVANAPAPYYVCEISSFQLDHIVHFAPEVAIITNITPDHLDRYDHNMKKYAAAKFRIASNQTSAHTLIVNADDATTMQYMTPEAIKSNVKYFHNTDISDHLYGADGVNQYDLSGALLIGRHNKANMAMAIMALEAINIQGEAILAGINTFQPLPHRLELIATIDGVDYINDSKATNVDATWYALEGMTKPVVWIAGGTDKGNDYTLLMPLVKEKVRCLICMGMDNTKIIHAFGAMVPDYVEADSAAKAVALAHIHAKAGEVVLLSPACASFDLFKNYEDRGEQFKLAIRNLL